MGNKGTRITFGEKLHGTNVTLNKGGVVASRMNKSSTVDTIAYVEQEIPKGVKIEIRVDEKYKQTEGSMKIGFTTKLPKAVCSNGDELLSVADYWIASDSTVTNFGESRSIKFNYAKLSVGDIVSIRVREDDGRICCYVNGKYKRYTGKPVNIPALRRNLGVFYAFVELSGAISKVSLLPMANPDPKHQGSPQLTPKNARHLQSPKRPQRDSMRRAMSIPAIATTQLDEAATTLNPVASGSQDSLPDERDDSPDEKQESFRKYSTLQRKRSTSLPPGSWNASAVEETSNKDSIKKRHSMMSFLSNSSSSEPLTKLVTVQLEKPLLKELSKEDSADSDDNTCDQTLVNHGKKEMVLLPLVLRDFLISWDDVDTNFHTVISNGTFGISYKSKWMETDCLITRYKKVLYPDEVLYSKYKKLVKIRHPNLLQLLGFVKDVEENALLSITEQLPMTLDAVLNRRSTSELPVGSKLTIASDVTKALCYLHHQSHPIVHCAVIPANIHLTAFSSAKLSNVGFGEVAITNRSVLHNYLPLEAITDAPQISPPLDVFSFGVTLVQLVAHKELSHRNGPINEDTEKQRVSEAVQLIGKDHALSDLVQQCLCVKPEDRPSASNLCSGLHQVTISLLES